MRSGSRGSGWRSSGRLSSSCSSARRDRSSPSYILPMFAPLALVVGWLLVAPSATDALPADAAAGHHRASCVEVALVVAFDHYAPRVRRQADAGRACCSSSARGLKVAAVVASIGSVAALVALRPPGGRAATARFWGVAALAFSTLGALQIAVAGFDAFSPMRSTSAILRAAQASAPLAADAPFYQVAMYDQTVPFYLGRTTRLVAFRDELALGIDAEPTKQIPTLDALDRRMERARGRLCADAAGPRRLARRAGRPDARTRARSSPRRREPAMSAAGPPRVANSAPSGGSAAASAASVGAHR